MMIPWLLELVHGISGVVVRLLCSCPRLWWLTPGMASRDETNPMNRLRSAE